MNRITSVFGFGLRGWLGRGRLRSLFIFILAVAVAAGAVAAGIDWFGLEKDRRAPVDYGFGPGKPKGIRPLWRLGDVPKKIVGTAAQPRTRPTTTVPPKAASPSWGGFFGPPFAWPIIPLHVALLPDGRVLSYGTDQN